VASHNDQASLVLVRACSSTVWSSARSGSTPAMLAGQRYGIVTTRTAVGPTPRTC
jgi:hypothetical protein